MTFNIIHHLLQTQAEQTPDAVAITAPNRLPLTYQALLSHVETIVSQFNHLGVQRNDRVALVLPSGPEMTVAFVATIAGVTAAPLNPAYRANELDFYLSDLNAKAVIVLAGEDSPVREVAEQKNLILLELNPLLDQAAGLFTLSTPDGTIIETDVAPAFAEADDVAFVLHTSGTTAKPKLVPCTQANVMAGAAMTGESLQLGPTDRYLRIMPLFHTHALITTLTSLSTGGTLFAAPDFNATQFFDWFQKFKPTWYSAAPTLHQAILQQAQAQPDLVAANDLRFIRSSAAALPPIVRKQLEAAFGVTVVEGYGMTESALYLTNNPLDKPKAGSVGVAVGNEVGIMSETGELLPDGQRGEIVVRGANIISGYENNPTANEQTFRNGWFRTGDIGHVDDEGYVFLTGRIKEMINRGGQKIAPLEVDETMKGHPDVVEVVTFAMPHPTLGEDIASAVVLRADSRSTAMDLRKFAMGRLAPYKVPSQIAILAEIPKGPTGKIQRINLAQELGDQLTTEFVHPRNWVEEKIAQIWGDVLGIEQIGVNDNFFALGGHSLFAMQITSRLRKEMQFEINLNTMFETPTVAGLAEVLLDKPQPTSIPIQSISAPMTPKITTPATPQPVSSPISNGQSDRHPHDMDISLIFFSADGSATSGNKYQLFLDSVRFADEHGFKAVWTPERHFHPFGGLYPNPSVLGAAMATMTKNIHIRAGSVVIPFQDPLRVAEEWSVIDNLSGGRVGIAAASGWHANDFVLAPDNFENRKQIMDERIEIIQKLWRGETITRPNGTGKPTEIRIYPDPVQPQLPMWLASHGDATFIKAGEMGINLLTVLWDTTIEELSRKVELYHRALEQHGHDPAARSVTLMMHTYVDDSMDVVREKVKSAYEEYLYVNLGLQHDQSEGLNRTIDLNQDDKEFIIAQATDQLFKTRGLVGTPEICVEKMKVLQAIGVTEIACLVDFGVDYLSMMNSLAKLHEVKETYHEQAGAVEVEMEEDWI